MNRYHVVKNPTLCDHTIIKGEFQMYPINDIDGIEEQERHIDGNHVIILLFVKPSDVRADEILNQINYLHHKEKGYCSICLIGYAHKSCNTYPDTQIVSGINEELFR